MEPSGAQWTALPRRQWARLGTRPPSCEPFQRRSNALGGSRVRELARELDGVAAVGALRVAAAAAKGDDARYDANGKQHATPKPSATRCGVFYLAHLHHKMNTS